MTAQGTTAATVVTWGAATMMAGGKTTAALAMAALSGERGRGERGARCEHGQNMDCTREFQDHGAGLSQRAAKVQFANIRRPSAAVVQARLRS